ncbi:MAG: biopolymer transporter ExbD [Gammaproteobacteria bacterium]|nr:biopolymer transporter ExbD [Gammaproteobacteria bacterium]MDH5276884.1 biopolymer transporter ExbD [Gammaproteobacteria bacterium]
MGMNVQVEGGGEEEVLSAINTTPLVDVMLVMLIIFLITIPVITKTVKLNLPKATNIATVTKPENITVAVDERGNIYWKESRVPNPQALSDLIRSAAVTVPQPEIHVRGDRNVRYEHVGRVILQLRKGGIQKVGFISEPNRGGPR